jgi:hypothetical protein
MEKGTPANKHKHDPIDGDAHAHIGQKHQQKPAKFLGWRNDFVNLTLHYNVEM